MLGLRWEGLLFLVLSLCWMGLIFYASSQEDPFLFLRSSDGRVLGDAGESGLLSTVGHLFAFGAMAVLLRLAWGRRHADLAVYLAAFLVTLAFAVFDETHQRFTPGRVASAEDVGIDAAGALFGLACWHLLESVPLVKQLGWRW